jgi:3-dehydroquinate synthase
VSLVVPSRIRDYEARLEEGPDFLAGLASHQQACFVVDENVWRLYRETLLKDIPEQETIKFPIGEDKKNLETVQLLYDILVERPERRNLTLIAIGGGILQDIVGFTASTLYRGIGWIFIPTTLLAQADSCIGSKTSLNFRGYKNLVGTFYPPSVIHIYPVFLETQLDIDYYSGMGEVIKLHLMGGRRRYSHVARLLPDILGRKREALVSAIEGSLAVKLDYLKGDEFDTGRRNLLNYGHDFGHALESVSGFSVPHGQAVIFGMLAANLVARKRSLLSEKIEREIAETVLLPSLVAKPRLQDLEPDAIVDAMKRDKKRTGENLALIMMADDFEFKRVNDLAPQEVVCVLDVLGKQCT